MTGKNTLRDFLRERAQEKERHEQDAVKRKRYTRAIQNQAEAQAIYDVIIEITGWVPNVLDIPVSRLSEIIRDEQTT